MNSDKILRRELIKRSSSKSWRIACDEWSIVTIKVVKDEEIKCICTQPHIREAYLIHNRYTLMGVIVGSTCVEKICGFNYYKFKYEHKRVNP